jgi:hypothetical protein
MKDMSISFKRPHDRSSSHHITLHSNTSHYITLHYITSRHVTSRQVMSPYIMSCHVKSRHITSHYIMSCQVTSCHVTSRHVTSEYGTSRHVTIMLSNPIYPSAKSIASTWLAANATELMSSLSSSYVENAGASSASLALTFIKLLDMMPLSFLWVCPTDMDGHDGLLALLPNDSWCSCVNGHRPFYKWLISSQLLGCQNNKSRSRMRRQTNCSRCLTNACHNSS